VKVALPAELFSRAIVTGVEAATLEIAVPTLTVDALTIPGVTPPRVPGIAGLKEPVPLGVAHTAVVEFVAVGTIPADGNPVTVTPPTAVALPAVVADVAVVAVAALPVMFKPTTGVELATVSGGVPVATVEINCVPDTVVPTVIDPEKLADVPFSGPVSVPPVKGNPPIPEDASTYALVAACAGKVGVGTVVDPLKASLPECVLFPVYAQFDPDEQNVAL